MHTYDTAVAWAMAKPRRLPSTPRALTPQELMAITDTARTIGNDVILDTLLLRLHTETAARRGGALALRLMDLDTEHCMVLLREKGDAIHRQPAVRLRGTVVICLLFSLQLPFSGKAVQRIFLSGGQEAFFEVHEHAFRVLGGVPFGQIRYDNLKAAVARVLGFSRQRVETERWTAFRSHWDIEPFYCQPGLQDAHEKGGVEGQIGWFRRNHLVPVPDVESLAERHVPNQRRQILDQNRPRPPVALPGLGETCRVAVRSTKARPKTGPLLARGPLCCSYPPARVAAVTATRTAAASGVHPHATTPSA
jgi:hypothetical protein